MNNPPPGSSSEQVNNMATSVKISNNIMARSRDRMRDLLDSGAIMRPDHEEFMEILIDEM